jgi:hypothetical protein
MSPVSCQRYDVTFEDYGTYRITVDAVSAEMAIKKARRIYHINGLGDDAFEPLRKFARGWKAEPLVLEVCK